MKSIILALAILSIAAPAFALMGFLQSQQTNGMVKYCAYSNGIIITIPWSEFCPLTIN